MEHFSKIQTGISGILMLAILVLSIVTMTVCVSTRASVNELALPESTPAGAISVGGTPVADTQREETTAPPPNNPLYVMTLREGAIVVLDATGSVMRTLTTHAIFLPAGDYELLSEGIRIYSESELASYIEDFGS